MKTNSINQGPRVHQTGNTVSSVESESQVDSKQTLLNDARRGPVSRDIRGESVYVSEPVYVSLANQRGGDSRSNPSLDACRHAWRASTEYSRFEPDLNELFQSLIADPDRLPNEIELDKCLPPSEAHLLAVNPFAMTQGMLAKSALAGGTTAYLTSFGLAELAAGATRAGGHTVPSWGQGIMAGMLHAVFAEVFGAALRGNRGTFASPANKAFDEALTKFCNEVEAAWAYGHDIDYAPLRTLLSEHFVPHVLSDEIAFSPFAVSGAVAAYINNTVISRLLAPADHKAAFEMATAAIRIALGAFVGGAGTAGAQHVLRQGIQGSPTPAPGKVHRPQRKAFLAWRHEYAFAQRQAILQVAELNIEQAKQRIRDKYTGYKNDKGDKGDKGKTKLSLEDAKRLNELEGLSIRVKEADFELTQKIKAESAVLKKETAALGDSEDPLSSLETLRADLESVTIQLAKKKENWPAVRSTMATAVANAAATAFGFLIPVMATAQTAITVQNSTVTEHYTQPVDDLTANGMLPISMIFSWMLLRRPLKIVVESGASTLAGMAGRLFHGLRPGPAADVATDVRAALDIQDAQEQRQGSTYAASSDSSDSIIELT